ncbi:MAG: hypothetical protein GF384_03510 [Elusimicrobia bacterium]|nr:hypothetical protein [Elusimicrobiota bacterium]MBD3411981.1 hypothetical protein [Elusimicrobiota bacterium]
MNILKYFFIVRVISFYTTVGIICALASGALAQHHAPLTQEQLDTDLSYYMKISRKKDLTANDRLYILNRLFEKYKDTDLDLTVLNAERKRYKENRSMSADQTKVLRPGQRLVIMVTPATEFSSETTVDRQGNIRLHLAGSVMIAGQTLREAEQSITKSLQRFIAQPSVKIEIIQSADDTKTVHLLGSADDPGKHALSDYPDLATLLVEKGGITATGQDRSITLFRLDESGNRRETTISSTQLFKDNSLNIPLQHQDIVWIQPHDNKRTISRGAIFAWSSILIAGTIIALVIL